MPAIRGEASFDAGGKDYRLVYDINALCSVEDATGLNIGDVLVQLDSGLSLTLLRAVVWGGLQRNHRCSLLDAGEIIAEAGAADKVATAMRTALMGAFPKPDAEATKNPQKAAA